MARAIETTFTLAGIPAARVARFRAEHQAGRPFHCEVELVLDDEFELDALLGHRAELAFGPAGEEPRRIGGIVEEASAIGGGELGADDRGTRYRLRIASRLGLLSRSFGSQIFQEKSVKDIVTAVLAEHGADKVEWRLAAEYPTREYCVQYQESALDFVSRLLEHEGIYSFIEPGEGPGDETVVFADDSPTAGPIPGDPELPLRRRTGALEEIGDAILSLRERRRVRSGRFTLRDFDWKRPKLDLTADAEADERGDLAVYDYPGGYVEPSEGERLARVRLEAEQVERHTLEIEAACHRLIVGHTLKITDAGDLDGEYFIFATTQAYEHAREGDSAPRVTCRARLLPKDIPYRPARVTPIPVVEGPETATVVAPAGSPPETIHTDEHGRCKVRFHWDRSGINDDKASCWMRVAQPQTSGSMMLPRIGWEVLVEFLEGDPDRPFVSARLYNGAIMPPYALPEGKTRTSLRTASTPGGGGMNEIRFEDKAGAEEIMIHAQHDMKVAVANNAKKSIGNNETTVVGNNASLEVSGNQAVKVTKGSRGTVGGSQTVSVGGNRSVEVNAVAALTSHGDATTSVGGNQFEMDGNPLEALLALAAQAAEQFAQSLADNAVAAVQAHVDGALNQVMAPINALNDRIQGVQQAMQAVSDGDLGAVAGLVGNAAGIPGASDFASALGGGGETASRGGGGGEVASRAGAGGDTGAGGGGSPTNPLAAMARGAANQAIHQGVSAAHQALAGALGLDAGGGGGQSGANVAGPEGDVPGVDATDREKGPGHSTAKVAGSHEESVGSMKVLGALQDINTNVNGAKTIDVGAATVQLAVGSIAESVGGSKNEKALGLVVLSKGGESEQVGGSKTVMVGGAIVDKHGGSHAIQAAGPATFIGAFHKVEAAGSITFKCGASEVVVDGSGVTITSPLVAFLAPKIQLPKKVSEV